MTSTLPARPAVSGALGSAIANTGSYPFDLVATKVQLSRTKQRRNGLRAAASILQRVLETRGISGFYDGLEMDTGATLLSSFFYFYAHSLRRMILLRRKARAQAKAVLSVFEELLVGYMAGNEREKDEKSDAELEADTEEPKGVVAVVRELYDEGGLAGFWRGFTLTILLSCNPALTYAFTSLFLRAMRRTRPTPSQSLLAGATGNALAVCIIYPLILAKTRLSASVTRTTIRNVLQDAIKRHGARGLYQGLQVQVLKGRLLIRPLPGFLNQGLTVMAKQRRDDPVNPA